MSKKKPSIPSLQKKLDAIFSKWLRLSSADHAGMVKCYTCPSIKHWKEMQCGHFHSRRYLSLRWYRLNVAPQCPSCNLFNQGAGAEFANSIIRDYGVKTLQELSAEKNKTIKLDRGDYLLMIEQYTEKFNKLCA